MMLQNIYNKLNRFTVENNRFKRKFEMASADDLKEGYAKVQKAVEQGQELLDAMDDFMSLYQEQVKTMQNLYYDLYDQMNEGFGEADSILMDYNDAAFELGVDPDSNSDYSELKKELERSRNLVDDVDTKVRETRQYINF